MSHTVITEIRKGFYLDSVALMRMSRTLAEMKGVEEAAMMMGTPSNCEIMRDAGLMTSATENAGGGDLIIGIRAISDAAADAALVEAKSQLDQPTANDGGEKTWKPRSLRAALKIEPTANLALISVPGDFAIAEARKAIRRGLHVMIFSDNVDLGEEAELKREAQELGCLVMGPDCGTAIINGTPLAFANVIPRGSIGIAGASGTGIQEVSSLIAQYGSGISHVIGVGGRDLKSEVGAISTLMALDALDADPMTKHIVIVSKPPPAEIAAKVMGRIAKSAKPATICFIGSEKMEMPANATQAFTLKQAAQMAANFTEDQAPKPQSPIRVPAERTFVKGLFSGGTLCAESQAIMCKAGEIVQSNTPIPGVSGLAEENHCHTILDLGDDQYTKGKPHPMIDPSVRDDMFQAALNDPKTAIILMDMVIGYGAHEDPAGHLAGVLAAYGNQHSPVIITSVTGTEGDPQVRSEQIEKLQAAGIHVAPTNADATSWALSAIQTEI